MEVNIQNEQIFLNNFVFVVEMSFSAKALYDYEAKTPQEISIKVGDIFNVLNQHESGWWVIEYNGKKGM